jgi:hypothetical protein
MNVFVLCTGRSGSTSFIKACQHISNYSAAHETLSNSCGDKRFDFPKNHIEADNRLSWQLGQLNEKFGKNAFYVHLKRNSKSVAKSYYKRFLLPKSMIYAYANGIKKLPPESLNPNERFEVCLDYVETVNANIKYFLEDKPHKIEIDLEDIKPKFESFWKTIKAQGNLNLALSEFDHKHNKSSSKTVHWRYSLKHLWLKFLMILRS